MGHGQRPKKGSRSKNKAYRRSHLTKNRAKDVDQIQDELKAIAEGLPKQPAPPSYDDELPGSGMYYCRECDRHFITHDALNKHIRTKVHKRRMKDLEQPQYTHLEAELAAGMSKPDH